MGRCLFPPRIFSTMPLLSSQHLFSDLSQNVSSPGNGICRYMELAISTPAVTETIAITHCTCTWKDGQAGWLVYYRDNILAKKFAIPLCSVTSLMHATPLLLVKTANSELLQDSELTACSNCVFCVNAGITQTSGQACRSDTCALSTVLRVSAICRCKPLKLIVDWLVIVWCCCLLPAFCSFLCSLCWWFSLCCMTVVWSDCTVFFPTILPEL